MTKKLEQLTGYPSIDKPWLKYYNEEAINVPSDVSLNVENYGSVNCGR